MQILKKLLGFKLAGQSHPQVCWTWGYSIIFLPTVPAPSHGINTSFPTKLTLGIPSEIWENILICMTDKHLQFSLLFPFTIAKSLSGDYPKSQSSPSLSFVSKLMLRNHWSTSILAMVAWRCNCYLVADLETKLEKGLGKVNCEQELIELEYKIAALLGGLCGSICTETIWV